MPDNPKVADPNLQVPARLLARFRSDRKRLPLHPLEKAVLVAVALHLCFLPWALGTMHAWSQITSLVLATIGLVLALIPRTYSGDYALGIQLPAPSSQLLARATSYRLFPIPRLLRFPIFWIGLALLGYIALQASNPSWVWERSETQWWLRRVNDIPWLPTSVDTPFERFDAWRQFIIYASAWLTVCTVWTGFTRRRSLQILLTTLIINASALAILGFVQRITITGTSEILWHWDFPGGSVFGTFIYKNHAGAYFALLASLTVAAAIWTRDSGERSFKRSTPASLLFLASLLLGAGVLASASRGAVITLALFALAAVAWYFIRRARRSGQPGRPGSNTAITTLIVLMFLGISVVTLRYLDFSEIRNRFAVLSKDPGSTLESRELVYAAAETMLGDHGLRGVGAGGFRYLFPTYIQGFPEIYAQGRFFWDHAHRDWLEIPIELGAAGTLLLLLGGGYWLLFFYRSRAVWHSLAVPLLIGCSQTLAHAWFDFPFQCPAILCTWLALVAVSARWLELDSA